MPDQGQIERLSIPSDPERIREARRWLGRIVSREGWSRGEAHDLALALSEACSNAHRYGYGGQKDGRIDLSLALTPGRVELAVRDYGAGFDAAGYRDPDLSRPNECGYGIYLMKCLTDRVEHRPVSSGTLVVMVKSQRQTRRAAGVRRS